VSNKLTNNKFKKKIILKEIDLNLREKLPKINNKEKEIIIKKI